MNVRVNFLCSANTYADIKRRKNESRTYFFDRAAERLNRRMMRDEEAERKRR